MAGDWIKMRCDLAEDPAVIAMATKLRKDEFSIVGRLHAFWSWIDRQSRDGSAPGVTHAWLDKRVECRGFADAMVSVGWLLVTNDGLTIPNFDNHNGETAKARAVTTKRKQKSRAGLADVPPPVTPMSRAERDESVTREEKRREEKNHEHTSLPATPVLLELPKDGVADADVVLSVLKVLAPKMRPDEFTVSRWLRDVNPNPWLLCAALCDAQASIVNAREAAYATAILMRTFEDGFPMDDPRPYVEHALRSIQRQRGTAA